MPITVEEAQICLLDSASTESTKDYEPVQQDAALYDGLNRFVRETGCTTELLAITIAAGTAPLDIRNESGGSLFNSDQFISMWITDRDQDLKVKPYRSVRRRQSGQGKTGRPKIMAWATEHELIFGPTPDIAYTAVMRKRKPLAKWVFGSAPAQILDVPDEVVREVIRTGCKWYLLSGAPGHPDAVPALKEFLALIQSNKGRYADGRPGMDDRSEVGLGSQRRKTR